MSKVFGIGWAKTGTTSLGKCFQLLGYRHQTQRLDLVPAVASGDLSSIERVVAEHDSFEDWPWIILFRELDELFPQSKFVLTVRDESRWLRSYRNMVQRQGEASEEMNETRRTLYGLPFPDVTDEQLLQRYRDHNEQVREYFEARPESLLVVNWEEGDGWEQLCAFLDVPVPSDPFPHANVGVYGQNQKGRLGWVKRKVSRLLRLRADA